MAPNRTTTPAELDRAIARLQEASREFARLSVERRRALLEELLERSVRTAEEAVHAACAAKGIALGQIEEAEEWLAGPVIQVRHTRLLVEALRDIGTRGAPFVNWRAARTRPDGGLAVPVFPVNLFERVVFAGFSVETWLDEGLSRHEAEARQASFYRDAIHRPPDGGVSLVLGAGNVASIGPLDVLHKMFVEGRVCLLKMNPVNDYLGPIIERQFASFVERGYLAVCYGGADVGAYLVDHDGIDDIHITGSDRTHDAIVWGATDEERAQRQRRGEPRLRKAITSELGNVTPLLVCPGTYDDRELADMAANIAGMVTNNASFNCNAAKLLVTPRGWPQRDELLGRIGQVLDELPARLAYYPGAIDRYTVLTEGRDDVRTYGAGGEGRLPWTLLPGLDARDPQERAFRVEPFCAVLSETSVGSPDFGEFLAEAVRFVNERVWGTLTATVFVSPAAERDPGRAVLVDRAVADLRYGVVNVNHWGAVVYGLCSPPWGAAPGASLADIQSGQGWVHNTTMLEGVRKAVLRGPLVPFPRPPWYPGHRAAPSLARRLVDFEAAPAWRKLPGIGFDALRG